MAVNKVPISGIRIILHTCGLERTTFWMEVHYSQNLINTPYYWCPMLEHICVDVKTKFLLFSGVLTWLCKKQMKMKTLLKKWRMLYVHCMLFLPFVFPEGECNTCWLYIHVCRPHWVLTVPLLLFFYFTIFLLESQQRENKEEHANSQNSKITERN